ncbi:MAG: hypothetical protein PHF86_04470 [Candidatus Nanoarchaeia archaeon]|jgi:glucan phosphoethanolaminetransferase (alkaline phosphatase superfamily)|nr:hypothetical protein [Candidatus Nanoarchaeia archaeon]
MTTQVELLIVFFIIIVLFIIFRKTSFVKKYWKYAIVLVPAILMITLKILSRQKTTEKNNSEEKNANLKDEIISIKEKLEEVNTIVKVEAAVAVSKNDELMKELKEVQKIPDARERRKKLADMIG